MVNTKVRPSYCPLAYFSDIFISGKNVVISLYLTKSLISGTIVQDPSKTVSNDAEKCTKEPLSSSHDTKRDQGSETSELKPEADVDLNTMESENKEKEDDPSPSFSSLIDQVEHIAGVLSESKPVTNSSDVFTNLFHYFFHKFFSF